MDVPSPHLRLPSIVSATLLLHLLLHLSFTPGYLMPNPLHPLNNRITGFTMSPNSHYDPLSVFVVYRSSRSRGSVAFWVIRHSPPWSALKEETGNDNQGPRVLHRYTRPLPTHQSALGLLSALKKPIRLGNHAENNTFIFS